MTVRATKRGAARTSMDGRDADVLICGASFAGLAAARELAGSGARVLVLDRYEVGERATSACALVTPWAAVMGVEESLKQELPYMRFTTPHGSARVRLPWSWSSFDYRVLCRLLFAQCEGVEFETAKVHGRGDVAGSGAEGVADGETMVSVETDRGTISAPLVLDALGWRRMLDTPHVQPPDALISRGLEVHPRWDGSGDELHCWVERSLIRRGYGWSVPAGDEVRVGVGSYEPRDHVKEPTVALASREGLDVERFQGNWFPHALRPAVSDDGLVLFAGDSAGHCFPLSGEGIRTAFYFGIAAGRELRAVVEGRSSRAEAFARYGAFSASHAGAYRRALRLQRLGPALHDERGRHARPHVRRRDVVEVRQPHRPDRLAV
ncbi:MAG: NAD(P)/FAD-dependent oxidoreductase [Baekduiaceae bacterium]